MTTNQDTNDATRHCRVCGQAYTSKSAIIRNEARRQGLPLTDIPIPDAALPLTFSNTPAAPAAANGPGQDQQHRARKLYEQKLRKESSQPRPSVPSTDPITCNTIQAVPRRRTP